MSLTYTRRGDLTIKLISPRGTVAVLLPQRRQDSGSSFTDWEFMSTHTWGEDPKGTWTIELENRGKAFFTSFLMLFLIICDYKRSVKITDHFTCTSANVIYCITCTSCNKLYIGETGRQLGDRFHKHLSNVEKNDKEASKPVARHCNLPNHSKLHMAICGLSLHQGTMESRKNLEQKFIFQIGTLIPTVLTNAFHLTNVFLFFMLPCYCQ